MASLGRSSIASGAHSTARSSILSTATGTSDGDLDYLEGWVWKQKRTTALVPGFKKVYARLDLETLELAFMQKEDAPPTKYGLFTVVYKDASPETIRAKKLYWPLLPPAVTGVRVSAGIGGKMAYGLKLRTFHRNLCLYFEEKAERDGWSQAILQSQKMYSETVTPRKSTVKTLLEESWSQDRRRSSTAKVSEVEKGTTEKTGEESIHLVEDAPVPAASGLSAASITLEVEQDVPGAGLGFQKPGNGLPDEIIGEKRPSTATRAQDLLVHHMAEVPPEHIYGDSGCNHNDPEGDQADGCGCWY